MKKFQTDSFTIAHYILLVLVILVGVWLVLWAVRSGDASAEKITYGDNKSGNQSCAEIAINAVADMWVNHPDKVPSEYIDMTNQYANRIVEVKTRGNCNGIAFVCEMGVARASCDPCAMAIARQRAIDKHTADMISESCNLIILANGNK